MQSKRKRNSRKDEAEVTGASTGSMAGAKSSGSETADENAARVVQSTEHGKETVTVSAWVAMLPDRTDRYVKGRGSRKRV